MSCHCPHCGKALAIVAGKEEFVPPVVERMKKEEHSALEVREAVKAIKFADRLLFFFQGGEKTPIKWAKSIGGGLFVQITENYFAPVYCRRSLQSVPPLVESKCTTSGLLFSNGLDGLFARRDFRLSA